MPEWEITATTVRCAAVDDEVTILLAGNAPAVCTWRSRRLNEARRTGNNRCQEGDCALITETIARLDQ